MATGVTNPEGTVTLGLCGANLLGGADVPVVVWGPYDQYGYTTPGLAPMARPEAHWESTDMDLENADQVKTVRSVILTLDANGANELVLDAYPDYGWEMVDTESAGTYVYDRPRFSVYGTAVIGTDKYGVTGVTNIRFDLNNMWCRRFRFKVRSQSVFALHGFSIDYEIKGPDKPYSPNMATGSVPAGMKP
jgi:hypothetical protein